MSSLDVIWHDLECGGYTADLPLWRELAQAESGPVLEVGAGTGRVALDLARRGHDVVALDNEPTLLAALRERAAGGTGAPAIRTVLGDAVDVDLTGCRFGLVIVPMQTLQLLGATRRAGFLRRAHAQLAPGGLLACALAIDLEPWSSPPAVLPMANSTTVGGVTYESQSVGLRDDGTRAALLRIRTVLPADAPASSVDDAIHLHRVEVAEIEAAGLAAGFSAQPARAIAGTPGRASRTIVLLRRE